MKIGEVYESTIKNKEQKLYRFIVDDSTQIQIIQTVSKGHVSTVFGFNENGDNPISTIKDQQSVTLKRDDKNFQVEKIYYLIVTASEDSEFSLLV